MTNTIISKQLWQVEYFGLVELKEGTLLCVLLNMKQGSIVAVIL